MMTKRFLAFAVAGMMTILGGSAWAGGFEIPANGTRAVGRGGATAVGVTDLTALHYNPGKLATLDGTHFMWHHNIIAHELSFQRATLGPQWGDLAGTTFDEVSDANSLFALGGFIAFASDFGLDDFMFALGAYGPASVGSRDFPDYGPQSFMLTDLDVLLLHYSLAVAYNYEDFFGVGITLQYVDMPSMKFALVVDSTPSPKGSSIDPIPAGGGTSSQLLTELQLEDRTGFSAILGLWLRPLPFLEFGVTSRFIPIALNPTGSVVVDRPELVSGDVTASMNLTLPAMVWGGVRFIFEDAEEDRYWGDLELDVYWENWSTINAYDIEFDGAINGLPIQDQTVPKAWKDTISVRLGGEVNIIPDHLQIRAGGFWESAAVPDNYANLDVPSFNRYGVGAGLTGSYYGVSLSVAYMHIFQDDVTVSEEFGKASQLRPLQPCPDGCGGVTGVPANAGTFKSSFDLISIGIDFDIGYWISQAISDDEPESEPASEFDTKAGSEAGVDRRDRDLFSPEMDRSTR